MGPEPMDTTDNEPDMTAAGTVVATIARVEDLLRKLADELATTPATATTTEWLQLRAGIGRTMVSLQDTLSDVDRHFEVTSARKRILSYLQANVGQTVTKSDLSGVAGISEWARRVRELREDEGWLIHTATTNPSMTPGEYRLVAAEPQPDVVTVWKTAKLAAKLTTRGGAVDPTTRLAWFLGQIHPRPAAVDQARHVVGDDLTSALRALQRRGTIIETIPLDDLVCPGGIRLVSSPVDDIC